MGHGQLGGGQNEWHGQTRTAFSRSGRPLGAEPVAFPATSTGVYGYPVQPAAAIAVRTVRTALTQVRVVRFVCFNRETLDAYQALLPGQQP